MECIIEVQYVGNPPSCLPKKDKKCTFHKAHTLLKFTKHHQRCEAFRVRCLKAETQAVGWAEIKVLKWKEITPNTVTGEEGESSTACFLFCFIYYNLFILCSPLISFSFQISARFMLTPVWWCEKKNSQNRTKNSKQVNRMYTHKKRIYEIK